MSVPMAFMSTQMAPSTASVPLAVAWTSQALAVWVSDQFASQERKEQSGAGQTSPPVGPCPSASITLPTHSSFFPLFTCSFTYLFTLSFTLLLTYSPSQSFIYFLITHSFTYPFTHSFTCLLIHSLIHSSAHSVTHSFIY